MTGMLRLYCGHHKCASHWIRTILDELAKKAGMRHSWCSPAREFDFHVNSGVDIISWVNAEYERLRGDRLPPGTRGFHVVRHPADILVSAYFSHKYSHPTRSWKSLIPYRRKLQDVSKHDGLMLEFDNVLTKHALTQMRAWDLEDTRFENIRMETVVAKSKSSGFWWDFWDDLVGFLGIDVSAHGLQSVLEAHTFRRMTQRPNPESEAQAEQYGGRDPGEEDVRHHYRKGVPGDWMNHLDADHIARLDAEYGDVLKKWGYTLEDNGKGGVESWQPIRSRIECR